MALKLREVTVEVRTADLQRVGQITNQRLNLNLTIVLNAAGEWALTLPVDDPLAPALATPGAGIIVTHVRAGVLASGPVIQWAVEASGENSAGTLQVTGTTDDVLLARRLAYPTPKTSDVKKQSDGYDIRQGPAETVIGQYINANIGASAPAARKIPGLVVAASQGRGQTVKKSARFPTLAELAAELAGPSRLVIRVRQTDDATVQVTTDVARDQTRVVRLDFRNGTLASHSSATASPTVTRAIVAGQGEGSERTLLEVTSDDAKEAETAWGRWGRIEQFIDQRQTDDATELQTAGDEALAEGGRTIATSSLVPADTTTMAWPDDWTVGDLITVVADDVEYVEQVTAATLILDAEGVRVGAQIGVDGEADATSRVSSLERNSGTAGDTGWQELPLSSQVVAYSSGTVPHYRKVGNLVQVTGAVKPKTATDASALTGTTGIPFVVLPASIRPTGIAMAATTTLHQGSGTATWLARLATGDGATLYASRYRGGTPSTSTWLPFTQTWFVDNDDTAALVRHDDLTKPAPGGPDPYYPIDDDLTGS